MANTKIPLFTTTLTGTVTAIDIDVSSYTGYSDLEIVCDFAPVNAVSYVGLQFNGVTASNYSTIRLYGYGTSPASSDNSSNAGSMILGTVGTSRSLQIFNIQDFRNTTTYKVGVSRDTLQNFRTGSCVATWRGATNTSTEAITSIKIIAPDCSGFTSGSTINVYGIRSEGFSGTKATGGAVYADSDYFYHVFGSTGVFAPTQSISADILVLAGGGGAGSGGGGAGGALTFTSQSLTATTYTCTVGAGGPGGNFGSSLRGTNGGNSQFGSLTACVGGGGGGMRESQGSGAAGGSGGGGSASSVASQSGGSFTSGQGFAGGSQSNTGTPYSGAGGGGAGAAGGNVTTAGVPGNGGVGITSSFITAVVNATGIGQLVGSNGYVAGGGGGGNYGSGGSATSIGGFGGGGAGSNFSILGSSGLINSGSGGGAGSSVAPDGGFSGGSGSVIIRYARA